jgi:protocatechuate 3,4-dioxygenase beta subunit
MPGKTVDRNPSIETRGYRRPQPGTQPEYWHRPYASSELRSPRIPLVSIPHTLTEITGPNFGAGDITAGGNDLTRRHGKPPIGERIIVHGQVRDEDGRPTPNTLVEVWQANAAGRYLHARDQHDAPLDPNFTGQGSTLTDADGNYRFVSIRPGCYPWRNHNNAWRPAHIHFSLFGPAFATRLVTQMYFPGDPLLDADPIFNCTADAAARQRLVAAFDWQTTIPETALGYRFDLILRGRDATPLDATESVPATTSQTVGPFFQIGFEPLKRLDIASPNAFGERVTVEGRVLDGEGNAVPDACLEIWQADARGRYPESGERPTTEGERFRGFGRVPTDDSGRFRFTTIKPGAVESPNGTTQAPHLAVSIFTRGLMKGLVTRIYFPDEPRNAQDMILGLVEPARRQTLVATRVTDLPGLLHWDVVLQGANETVFLDC